MNMVFRVVQKSKHLFYNDNKEMIGVIVKMICLCGKRF